MACSVAPHNCICFMNKQALSSIEFELKKRWKFPYKWLRKQNNQWDAATNFIYHIPIWDNLIKRTDQISLTQNLDSVELFNYAINRWYNFWSAKAVEQIFSEIDGVTPNPNRKNREVDFEYFGIDFDHKTSVFPKHLKNDLRYAQANKRQLIQWLYKNQSTEKRQHFKNRLFVIVYNQNGDHWKLKAELELIKTEIHNYVANFSAEQLYSFIFAEGTKTYSDIIWVTK